MYHKERTNCKERVIRGPLVIGQEFIGIQPFGMWRWPTHPSPPHKKVFFPSELVLYMNIFSFIKGGVRFSPALFLFYHYSSYYSLSSRTSSKSISRRSRCVGSFSTQKSLSFFFFFLVWFLFTAILKIPTWVAWRTSRHFMLYSWTISKADLQFKCVAISLIENGRCLCAGEWCFFFCVRN